MAKKYRVAVIGSTGRGNYGHGIDTVWLNIPEAEIVGVADDNKDGLAAAARRLKTENAFRDYREMLDRVKPQFVSICPRWLDQHHDMVLAAAERGIHIYLEKPLCRTLEEADSMVAACQRSHVRCAVAHQTHYSPKVRVVQDLLKSGAIGQVLEFRGRGKEDRRGGGEDLWVLGSHIMDLILLFGGQPQWCMASVRVDGRPITAADVVQGNEGIGPLAGDAVAAMYGMPNGAYAYFNTVRNAGGQPSRFGLQIYGSRGIIEILTGHMPEVKILQDAAWSPGRSGKAWQDVSSAGIGKPEPTPDGGLGAGNILAVRDLIAAVEEDREPLCSVSQARAGIEMIVAAFESQRQQGRVPMPLENRKNPLTMLKA
jgi:predicted dehydrogenase